MHTVPSAGKLAYGAKRGKLVTGAKRGNIQCQAWEISNWCKALENVPCNWLHARNNMQPDSRAG